MKNPVVEYYDNGQIWYEVYHNDKGEYHCENGPAYNEWYNKWYNNGQKKYEEYWINDKLHREDGPAWIKWNKDGQIEYEEYWINNVKLDIFDIRKLKLEKLNLL